MNKLGIISLLLISAAGCSEHASEEGTGRLQIRLDVDPSVTVSRTKSSDATAFTLEISRDGDIVRTISPIGETPDPIELTAGDYTRALSAQIAQMVSAITGESEPQVTVTLRTMGETVYATEDKQSEKSAEEYSGESLNRTQTDGDTQKTYILVKAADGSQKPLIVTKTEPEIRGVVVVSRGGSDPKMREKIVEAVKTALDLSSTQVCVVGYSEYTYGNE